MSGVLIHCYLLPIVGSWLSNPVPTQLLIHLTAIAIALSSKFFSYNAAAEGCLALHFNLPLFIITKVFIVTKVWEFMDIYQHEYSIAESAVPGKDIDQVYVVSRASSICRPYDLNI